MNKVSRTISGTVAILIGVVIFIGAIFEQPGGWYFVILYGLFFIIIGFFIFFNKKEDEIEQIKSNKKK